jgi:ribose-phosphate pyrophosphokinase
MRCLLTTNSNLTLATAVARLAGFKLGKVEIKKLKDGETYVRVLERVPGQKFVVLGSTAQPESNLLELLILINALKENRAKEIILILPYFGYARQDKVDKPGAPLSAKLMVNILKLAGVNKVLAVDLHSEKVVRFWGKSLKYLSALPVLAQILKSKIKGQNWLVIAPDKGAKKRATAVAKILGLNVLVAKKYRPRQNVAEVRGINADLTDQNLIVVDDMVDTAGTLVALVNELKAKGAAKIYCLITHALLSDPAISRLKSSRIDQLIVSDSIPLLPEKKIKKIKVISLAKLLAGEFKKI